MNSFLPVCLAVVLLSLPTESQTITSFDVPNGLNTQPIAISASGQVTGSYAVPNSTMVRGFLRDSKGNIITFDVSGMNTYPAAINIWGQVTGIYTADTAGTPPFHSFLRQPDGEIITFDAPDAWDTEATTIDAKGQIVGWMQSNLSVPNPNVFQAFVRRADGHITTFDIDNAFAILPLAANAEGQVIGHWTDFNGREGHGFFRQLSGKITNIDAPAAFPTDTWPYAINAWGQVVGAYTLQCPFPPGSCTTDPHSFLRQPNGTYLNIDVPHMTYSVAVGIDFIGQVTGYTYDNEHQQMSGFLRDFKGHVRTFEGPNSTWTVPLAISSLGEITGIYYDLNNNVHGFVLKQSGRW